jgi:integrase
MAAIVDITLFDYYFSVLRDDFEYDVNSAKFLLSSGCRPDEFLKLGISNLDLSLNTLSFIQSKDGLYTTRDIDPAIIQTIYDQWSVYGNPGTYYRTYGTLNSYLTRTILSRFDLPDRLDNLYSFRYACAGSLLKLGYTDEEIIVFYNHSNPNNTRFYIEKGNLINYQLSQT